MTINIFKNLKKKGKPVIIPNTSRDDLPEFFTTLGYEKGVEIGVYKGAYTKKFCDAGLTVFGIDPWTVYGNYLGPDPQNVDKNYEKQKDLKMEKYQKRQDFLFEHTKRYLEKYLKNGSCKLIRKTSMEAVEDFADESLDFVYIDGHHGFRYVAEDLVEWSKKVRIGGVVAGHDYALNKKGANDPYVLHIKYVLHAYIEAYGIDTFYVLGSTKPKGKRIFGNSRETYYDIYIDNGKEEIRDRWRSWFWIKKK